MPRYIKYSNIPLIYVTKVRILPVRQIAEGTGVSVVLDLFRRLAQNQDLRWGQNRGRAVT